MSLEDIRIESAANGLPTLRIGTRYLHSRHDPLREARRFCDGLTVSSRRIFILLFPGLAYLARELCTRFPHSLVLQIQAGMFSAGASVDLVRAEAEIAKADGQTGIASHADIRTWNPREEGLEQFLGQSLNEESLAFVEYVEWAPAVQVFRDQALEYGRRIRNFLGALKANLFVGMHFGRRWLGNMVRNAVCMDMGPGFMQTRGTLVIAASGPSLARCAETLVEEREKYILCSLPSSIEFFSKLGIVPDFVVSSDGGYWAGNHLSSIPLAWFSSGTFRLVAPLRAMLRPVWGKASFLPYRIGLPLEDELLNLMDERDGYFGFPDRGTVLASALDFHDASHRGEILLLGADFASHDMNQHVLPHGSDTRLSVRANRLEPRHSAMFETLSAAAGSDLVNQWKTTESLRTFAAWFAESGNAYSNSVSYFNESGVDLPFRRVPVADLRSLLDRASRPVIEPAREIATQEPDSRQRIAARISLILAKIVSSLEASSRVASFRQLVALAAPFEYAKFSETEFNFGDSDLAWKNAAAEARNWLQKLSVEVEASAAERSELDA